MPVQSAPLTYGDILATNLQAHGEDVAITFTLYDGPVLPAPNPQPNPIDLTGVTPTGNAVGIGDGGIVYPLDFSITNPPGTDGKITLTIPAADIGDETVIASESDYMLWDIKSGNNTPLRKGRLFITR